MNLHEWKSRGLAALCAALLAACTTPKPDKASPGATLADTHWQLVTVESMNDGQTLYRVPDPTRYTLSFGKDGKAAFKLDCNVANAPWNGGSGSSGELKFGAVAMTRAVCPPPSLDRTVARALADVYSFKIVQGRLHMALYVEGGSYTWAPTPAPAAK
jgi:heat shock protein HslJ